MINTGNANRPERHFDDASGDEDIFPPELFSSLLLVPLAVATYNKQCQPSEPQLDVWLAHTRNLGKDPTGVSRQLKYVAEKVNDIHEGTVTTILFPHSYDSASFKEDLLENIRKEKSYKSVPFKTANNYGLIHFRDHCDEEEAKQLKFGEWA